MKRGFTIIELLVVVSIIGLLSSIVLASLKASKDKANSSVASTEARQIATAAEIVFSDYGYYPNDSHAGNTVTCPKDIEVDPVTHKKWGDYIKVCNDPWGRPYEWNNHCTISAADERRSATDPQPNCNAFSNDQAGPVGIVVNVDNQSGGATCSGSNICLGSQGFVTYNMSAPNSPGSQNSLAAMAICATTVSSCASFGANQCSYRDGCNLGSTSCTGTVSAACSTLADQPSCSTQTQNGCSWTSNSQCTGTVSCSAYSSDQTSCSANSCSYSPSFCSGTASSCSTWTNSPKVCAQQTGCSFDAAKLICTGTHTACASYTGASCTSQVGCTLNSAQCTGAPACSPFTTQQCPNVSGCSVLNTSQCQGTYSFNCSVNNSNQASCTGLSSCTWHAAACTGTASTCDSYANENSCLAQSGCSWQQGGVQ